MCARLFLSVTPEEVADLLDVELADLPPLIPRYNIAPGQDILVARTAPSGVRATALLRWGLVPRFAKDPAIGHRLINARSETAARRAAFRDALRFRRCVVPATGFYEWKKVGRVSQPYAVRPRSAGIGIAGLWEEWEGGGRRLRTCTLLTTEANASMAAVHDRMPVLLDRAQRDEWLDPDRPLEAVNAVMRPYPADGLTIEPVSTRVNRADFDDPSCLEPIAPSEMAPEQGRLF
jgi:putative SOS response-associated peptidase YedK